MKHFLRFAAMVLMLSAACEREVDSRAPGSVYRRISRPEIWQVLDSGQADSVGLLPGDLILSYNLEPVASNADLRAVQERAAEAGQPVVITVRRSGGEELDFVVKPGVLGILPVSYSYPADLALAIEDILITLGVASPGYDQLAALTGESFILAANERVCRAWWPGLVTGRELSEAAGPAGLVIERFYPSESGVDGHAALRLALESVADREPKRTILTAGGWPGYRNRFWGIVTRFNPGWGEQGVVFGYSLDSGEELPIVSRYSEAYFVGVAEDPGDNNLLGIALSRVIGGAADDAGLPAVYDRLVAGLDSAVFCPVCGPAESPDCFNRFTWSLLAHKESARRFLAEARTAVTGAGELFDELDSGLGQQVAILGAITARGADHYLTEERPELVRKLTELRDIETGLLVLYEELMARAVPANLSQ